MAPKHEAPAISKTAFNCPRCGTFAYQQWSNLHAVPLGSRKTPDPWKKERVDEIVADQKDIAEDKRIDKSVFDYWYKVAEGKILTSSSRSDPYSYVVENLFLSKCFSCQQESLWIYNRVAWPLQHEGPTPNEDLPPDVIADYQEAEAILGQSPRGATALLRLAIQKLCIHLGEAGKNLNADIGSLAKKGMDVRIQRALDIVRVIGNEAVHPGQMNLKDDTDTATELFRLVNLIAETMITQPKQLEAMYKSLPEAKRKQIEERDA